MMAGERVERKRKVNRNCNLKMNTGEHVIKKKKLAKN
jgi:hypothetical protein